MHSIKLNLGPDGRIWWPSRCALCGVDAEDVARATRYVKMGGQTEKTDTLSYPVCRRHKRLCTLLDRPAKWGFVGSFVALVLIPMIPLGVITIVAAGFAELKGDALSLLFWITAVLVYGGMAAFFIFAATRKPVKLLKVKKNAFKIKILSDNFFEVFKLLNADVMECDGNVKSSLFAYLKTTH